MKATTQVEAIPEPMEMLVQERKGHEFTPNALTVPTAEVAAEKTKERSVPKDLEPTCKPAQHHNKGNTALVTTITTTKVAAISNAAVTTTTAADTNSDKRAAIVHVTTMMRMAISHRLIVHATTPTLVLRARRRQAIKQIRAVTSHVRVDTSLVSRVVIRAVVDTTITAVVITTVADTTRVVTVSTVLIMIQMQSIHSRSVSNTRRKTSILMSQSA